MGAALVPPPSAPYHPDMSTTADEQVIVPSRVSAAVILLATLAATTLAVVQIVRADASLAARILAVPAVVLAALLIVRSWRPAACDRRVYGLQVAALAALLLAAGALAPSALAGALIICAALRIGRDVAGWRGLAAVAAIAVAHAAGLAVHGADAIPPAIGCGFVAVFLYGMAEPERGAWCACEWAKRGAIRNLDVWALRSDERPRRDP